MDMVRTPIRASSNVMNYWHEKAFSSESEYGERRERERAVTTAPPPFSYLRN